MNLTVNQANYELIKKKSSIMDTYEKWLDDKVMLIVGQEKYLLLILCGIRLLGIILLMIRLSKL